MAKKYYYHGKTLREYCKENNLSYDTYFSRVKRILKREDITEKEAVAKALNGYENINCLYYYEGMTLREYCQEHNYVYGTMLDYIKLMKKQNSDLSIDKIVPLAILYYKDNHIPVKKYYYHGIRLPKFCQDNNYDYEYMIEYLSNHVKDCFNITDEEMSKAIYRYNIYRRKNIFNLLQDETSYDEDIIDTLNIDRNSIKLVMAIGFNFKDAILFVWYFGKDNRKIIIDKARITEVYDNINHLEDLDIKELIGYYQIGIYDTREIIYQKLYLPTRKIIHNLCNKYLIHNRDLVLELSMLTDDLLMEFIHKNTSRNLGQIINYMNAFITGKLLNAIVNDFQFKKINSLNDNIELFKEEVNTEYFSDEVLNIINSLGHLERKIIFLKYQKQYSESEIIDLLNISFSEFMEIEKNALDILRQNSIIRNLRKKC